MVRGHDIVELFETTDDVVDLPAMLALVRLTRTEPGLREVWLRPRRRGTGVARALAERLGRPEDDLRVHVPAAMINTALRVAVEHHAFSTPPDVAPDEEALLGVVRAALRITEEGLPR